jgi:ribonucleotide reductase beta subunit family protein with ferritin-like domain
MIKKDCSGLDYGKQLQIKKLMNRDGNLHLILFSKIKKNLKEEFG